MTERTSGRSLRLALTSSAVTGLYALGQAPAAAQVTTIDDERTEPVLTSVAGDTTVAEEGSIAVTDRAALVLDADADVVQDGAVVVTGGGEDVAGVRITGEVAGSYAQAGSVTLDTPVQTITNEAPGGFASGRYGVLLEQEAAFTGPISFAPAASVLVEGSAGAAIGVLGALSGDLAVDGTAGVTGEGSAGVLIGEAARVDGDVTFGASATLSGAGIGADGLRVDGEVGRLEFRGTARASAYTDAAADILTPVEVDRDDEESGVEDVDQTTLAASGSAAVVTGTVREGALFDGTLETRGAGPALLVGGGASLGLREDDEETVDVDEATTFGLVTAGSVEADGVFDGVGATAMRVGEAEIEGGLRNTGGIVATSRGLDVDAVGLTLDEDASLDAIVNDGTITADAASDAGDAVAVLDRAGSVARLTNTNTINARLTDYVDAGFVAPAAGDGEDAPPRPDAGEPSGRAVAIDLSANEDGVEVRNTRATQARLDAEGEPVLDAGGTPVVDTVRVGQVFGDVITGSGDDLVLSDAAGASRNGAFLRGGIRGDVFLGEGDDRFELRGGSILVGDLFLGQGEDSVLLAGGRSRITGTVDFGGDGGGFTIGEDVALGSLTTRAAAASDDAEDAAPGARLAFTVLDDGSGISSIDVAGDVTLAPDTLIETRFDRAFATEALSTEIIRTGGTLNADLDALSEVLTRTGPFLFEQVLSRDEDDTLSFTLRRKAAQEVGIDASAAPAYGPVLAALVAAGAEPDDEEEAALRQADTAIGAILFNTTSQDAFLEAFDQFLPGPLDAPLTYARVQNNSVTSLVTERVESLREGFGRERTAWLQEETFFVDRGEDAASRGFDGGGFVIAIGADTPLGPIDTVGISASIANARYDEQRGEDFPTDRLTYAAGVYAAEAIGRLRLDGRAAYGISSSEGKRVLVIGQTTDENGQRRSLTGEWDGTQLSAYGRVRYAAKAGEWDVVPFASLDYLRVEEDGYTEGGGRLDRNVALTVSDREATSLRGNAGLTLGRTYELTPSRFDTTIPGIVAPRLTAAWSQELDGDELEATYRFQGGEDFTLTQEKESGTAIVGADILYENQYAKLSGGVSGQFGEDVNAYTLRVGIGLKW